MRSISRAWSASRGARGATSSSRPAMALPKASPKVRPRASTSPTLFMWVVSSAGRARQLLEREPRDLDRDVVERGLEAGRGDAGDLVGQLVERVAHGQAGRDLGDREAGRLGGQRRAARDARVHLDDHDLAGRAVERELDVGAAGRDADGADHRDRRVAQALQLLVGERHHGRDGHRVAGVHAHRVDVLDRADDHRVVGDVAHHLQLDLGPSRAPTAPPAPARSGSPPAPPPGGARAPRACGRRRRPRRPA